MSIPILFPDTETRFAGMGIGGLGDALSVRVSWALNGPYELEMQYPTSGRRYADLAVRRIILATVGPDEDAQPFRIYRITAPLLSACTVYARHIAYDLMGYTLFPFQAANILEAAQQVTRGAVVQAHEFTVAPAFESDAGCTVVAPRSVWSMLGGQQGSLLDVYGGEWDFNRYTCMLRQQLGEDLGVLVRYGKNLKTLEQDENIASTWTGVQPYWLAADESVCVTLPEAVISTGDFDYVRVLVLDLSAEFQEQPTEEQLRARAKRYISSNRVGIPDVGLDVDFVPLEETEEFQDRSFLARVHKGDTVTVEFPTAFDPGTGEPRAFVRASSRTVETVWLPLEDRYERIRLGAKRANFVSVLAQAQKDLAWVMTKVKR